MNRKDSLTEEVKEHLNEIVLDGLQVVRLIGCGEDDDDLYYKYDEGYGQRYVLHGTGIYYSTAVGAPYYLKHVIPEADYKHLYLLRQLNGAPMVDDFEYDYL